MYPLLANTCYLSCSRQLASTYAMIANLRGQINHLDLADSSWTDDYRPNPTILIKSEGDASELIYWTKQHWERVRAHIKLVISQYEWIGLPEFEQSKRSLWSARLVTDGNNGYYDQMWFTLIDVWRRAEIATSRPIEVCDSIYCRDHYINPDKPQTWARAHGWPATRRCLSNGYCEIYAEDDLLPSAEKDINKPGTQAWLLAWYKDLSDLNKEILINDQTPLIASEDGGERRKAIECLEPVFSIGSHNPSWTYFLLQTIRMQLQAWRVKANAAIAPITGITEVTRLHGAAWPTSGELCRIINKLDQAMPCSQALDCSRRHSDDYLSKVLESLKYRWLDMANSWDDPSRIWWMQGERHWWQDRRNADQRPMPLLPETIVLILEVWLAGAIRSARFMDHYAATWSSSNLMYADNFIQFLKDNKCELQAQAPTGNNQHLLAYQIPSDLATRDIEKDTENDGEYYDAHRDEIRDAWIASRSKVLDELCEPFGLTPSKPELSRSEAMVQDWLNGLLDESLNDDLKLQKPSIKITSIQPMPGLSKPIKVEHMWQTGAKVQYSYKLRGLSSFQSSGNDQLSEISELSDPLILDEQASASGVAIQIPRDNLLLARQFMLFRTITAADKTEDTEKTSTLFVGSGHFDPGQLESAIFHDGNPPTPNVLETSNISIEHESKPPNEASWTDGNLVQYRLQYLDSNGTNTPTQYSALSEQIKITEPNCGFKLRIPSDDCGIATSVQLNRQIIDPNGKVVAKLKQIGLHTFPVSNDEGVKFVEILDASLTPAPAPVVFNLRMSQCGLELHRSDQDNPIWSSDPSRQARQDQTSCRMQHDGNLVIYNKDMRAYWQSDTMESAWQTDSQRALRLLPNGELAIVDSLKTGKVVKILIAGDPELPKEDRPAVYLRNGEMMLLNQVLSIDNQSPQSTH